MATTDNAIQYDIRFINELVQYMDYSPEKIQYLMEFLEDGLIQRETFAERAMVKAGENFSTDSRDGRDFCDGSDAKTVTSNARCNNWNRGVWTNSFEVRNIATKTGDLRVVAFNQILNRFHYFYIPNYAFCDLKSTLTIVIEQYNGYHYTAPNWTGIPNRNRKFWEFECESFADMCSRSPANLSEWDFEFA